MKLLKSLFVLALAAAVISPVAYAETQNVKVSGAIDAYWFYRVNYDLRDNNSIGVEPVGTASATYNGTAASATQRSEADDYFRSNTQIEVAADLTDNVSTVINIVNERDWNSDSFTDATTSTATGTNEFDLTLDLAYVQMKEIFYSPLTLTIGRQDLWFGRGFIIGNNHLSWDRQGSTQADEYSVTTAFDAARATLDFNPWTIDLVYALLDENSNNPEDDIDLYIANINYKFAEYNAVAEAYYVGEIDKATLAGTAGTHDNNTHTLGGRLQFDPISQITLGGELAYQFGNYRATLGGTRRDRTAWAADVFGTYRWDYTWKPEVTVEYVYFSGENDLGTGSSNDYSAWNSLYRGKFWTAYEDFREFQYGTSDAGDQSARTNHEMLQVKGSIKPLEDLLIEASFSYFWTPEDIHTTPTDPSTGSRANEIGYEIDAQVTYDYTEDVSFGFLLGYFVSGDFYENPNNDNAMDMVSSVKVTF